VKAKQLERARDITTKKKRSRGGQRTEMRQLWQILFSLQKGGILIGNSRIKNGPSRLFQKKERDAWRRQRLEKGKALGNSNPPGLQRKTKRRIQEKERYVEKSYKEGGLAQKGRARGRGRVRQKKGFRREGGGRGTS